MKETNCWTLLEDDSFVHWMLHPGSSVDAYWESWLRRDPRHQELVKEAKELLSQLQQYPPDADTKRLSREIWEGIILNVQEPAQPSIAKNWKGAWYTAAALALGLGATALLWKAHPQKVASYSSAVAMAPERVPSLLHYHNTTLKPERIYLIDGSRVILEKGSTLIYNPSLDGKTREVSLEGNAFFDIAKDASRPFLVHTGDIVTRVLGTSFEVKADPILDDIRVAVRTGKVSVYRDGNEGNAQIVYVLPHQEVVYYKKEQNLVFQSNAPAQLLIPPPADIVFLNFEDQPVISILDQLGKMYHIQIMSNRDSLCNCRLTTSLQNEKLTDQLSIICKAVNAGYEMKDDTVWIRGGHCQ
jgi:ferric-dicitrate binding protein FerR (iron transport regulator)